MHLRTGERRATRVIWVLGSLWLTACTADPPHGLSSLTSDTGGSVVRLVLVPDGSSNACCGIVTVNPGDRPVRVLCALRAFDPDGQLIYAGLVPGPPSGQRRSPFAGGTSGFRARPGREGHGRTNLPIDLDRDSYQATCRVAAWHGAPPI